MGLATAYLLKGQKGCILVDAGCKGKEQMFFDYLRKLGISPSEIKLIIVTHVHYDHVGGLALIKKSCQCPVAVHINEAALLREAQIAVPPPTNSVRRIFSSVSRKLSSIDRSFTPVEPEILISKELLLDDFGFDGVVLFTPGHTKGSVSVLLRSGEAFIGDLASSFPFQSMFPYAEEPEQVLKSWKKIIDFGCRTILPSHGSSFPVEKLSKEYDKRAKHCKRARSFAHESLPEHS